MFAETSPDIPAEAPDIPVVCEQCQPPRVIESKDLVEDHNAKYHSNDLPILRLSDIGTDFGMGGFDSEVAKDSDVGQQFQEMVSSGAVIDGLCNFFEDEFVTLFFL